MLVKLKDLFFRLVFLHLFFLLLLICLRIFEQCDLAITHSFPFKPLNYFTRGIEFDALFTSCIAVFIAIPYLLLGMWIPRFATISLKIILFILFFLHLALTQFFLSTLILLDDTIFYFSADEIKHVVTNETGGFGFWHILMIILLISVGIWLIFIKKRIEVKRILWFWISLPIFIFIFIVVIKNLKVITPSQNRFNSFIEYQLSNNKILYLVHSRIIHAEYRKKFDKISTGELKSAISTYHQLHPEFHFTNEDFPLLHDEPYENTLGKYFPEKKKAPNIVFILCESLSSSFCGPKARLPHFMPFLDSLITKSLYWENFLSNAERTYGVMPNVLASAPYGSERGFINNLDGVYPLHQSIFTLLHDNTYTTRFFYGGWGGFDHIRDFIKFNKPDLLIEESKFDHTKYHKQEKKESDLVWGFNDKDLFSQSFDMMSKENPGPCLNVYLTLTMHSPFNLLTKDYNQQKVTDFFVKSSATKEQKEDLIKYHDPIASILFSDDAFRQFFETYKNRPDFENTIFVITGDHNMYAFPLENELETYHVPLIIYSPMLESSKTFPAISFHSDVTPSIIGLLEGNFGLKFPTEKAWLARGLDTSSVFRCRNSMPLSLYSGNYSILVRDGAVYMNEMLYMIDENLRLTKIEDTRKHNRGDFHSILENFSLINSYVCIRSKIIPHP